MAVLSPRAIDLLSGLNLAYLATVNQDGSPHVAPLWVDVDADRDLILFNTAEGRRKVGNVRRDPRVGVSAHDREEPWPPLVISGRVTNITTEGALDHIDALCRRYNDGEPWEPRPGQVRLILEVTPESASFPET